MAQEGGGGMRLEIADGRSREEADTRLRSGTTRQPERLGEVGLDRQHGQPRIVASQLGRLLQQHLGRNVDRNIGGDRRRRLEQHPRLAGRTGAEFDQRRVGRNQLRHLGGMAFEDRKLAAGRIVFRQPRDLFEQLRAQLVVEVFRREPLRPRRQASNDVMRELRIRRRPVHAEAQSEPMQSWSPPSRWSKSQVP